MKKYKLTVFAVLTALFSFGAYAAFMYVYTESKFAPVRLFADPLQNAPSSAWQPASGQLFIHKVNTVRRAKNKDARYNGYELDILPAEEGGELFVAHDPAALPAKVKLADIFAALKRPQDKTYWLDLKAELTPAQLGEILQTAERFNIPRTNLLFEAPAGPTAKMIQKKGLSLLLQIPEGFDQDGKDPKRRNEINREALAEWEEYRPAAVSASFGKYPFLRGYFPNMPKAVYYSATRRPSLKKTFMARRMQEDPSVKVFLIDEYTW